MRSALSTAATWVGLLFVAMSATGCCGDKFRSFDTITVSLQDSYRDANNNPYRVEVDLIAVNDAQLANWKKIPVSQYYHSQHDQASVIEMTLGAGHTSQTISVNDPDPAKKKEAVKLWKDWESGQIKWLVAIADFPVPPAGTSAEDDPRRLILPLTCERWAGGQSDIQIMVTSLGLSPTTPPLPPK